MGLSSKKQSPKTDEELKRMLDIPYASAVGSIQYAAQCTRPNITYALSDTATDSTTEAEYIAASEAAKDARKQRNRDLITDPNTFLNDTICLER
ncbi:hypothetical protein Sango_0809400, partial [Sesamum angolense]